MNLSSTTLGFLRAMGIVLLMAALHFLSNQANLQGIVPDSIILLITGLASAFEHKYEANGNGAFFGAVHRK